LFKRIQKLGTSRYLDEPEPWFEFGAVDFLAESISPGMHIFEWGAGASTLWFQNQGMNVVAVEHDQQWIEKLSPRCNSTTRLIHSPLDNSYAMPDHDFSHIDLVVIDGRKRNECASTIANNIRDASLKSGCIIVFDDSNRHRYFSGIRELASVCATATHYSGISNNGEAKTTAIFLV